MWVLLYEEAYPMVERYATRFAGSRAGELAQDAFSLAYEKLSNFQGKSRFSTWICGFVRYIHYNRTTKAKRETQRTDYYWTFYTDIEMANPVDIVIRNERTKCLWKAFDSLTPFHQLLLNQIVLQGKSVRFTSRLFGIRETIIRHEYIRALKILKIRFVARYSGYPSYRIGKRSDSHIF